MSRAPDPVRMLELARMHLLEAKRCNAHQSAIIYWEAQVRHWERRVSASQA